MIGKNKKKRIRLKKKKSKKVKFIISVIIFIISIHKTFIYLLKSNIKLNNKEFVEILLNGNKYDSNIFKRIIKKIEVDYKPVNLLNINYNELNSDTTKVSKVLSNNIIYIYNTHQKEEYQPTNFVEAEVNPTVMMSSYIMKDVFDKNGLYSLVEERSINDVLEKNHWRYYKSYDVSRMYMEDAKINNPSLKYFIDVHRDSLPKEQTTTEINDKKYAKVIFLIGLENPNYEKNLVFTNKINDKLKEKYPTISKGIYKKGGQNVRLIDQERHDRRRQRRASLPGGSCR